MLLGIHSFNQRDRQAQIPEQYWFLMGLLLPAVSAAKGFSYYSLETWARIVDILQPRMVLVRLNHLDDLPQLKGLYDSDTLRGRIVVVELFNEPNNSIEPFQGIDDFWAQFWMARDWVRRYCPEWLIGFPGVSPSREYRSWWDGCRDAIDAADFLCVHLYYSQAGNVREQAAHLAEAKALVVDKPLIVSEFCYTGGESGRVRPTTDLAPEYGAAAQWLQSEGVAAMFYYILASDDPHWHDVSEVFDETLARYVGNIPGIIPGENDSGGTMKLSEEYPEIYQEWVAGGGIENNLRSHLLALGILSPTKADLLMLIDETKSKLDQVRLVAQSPFQ